MWLKAEHTTASSSKLYTLRLSVVLTGLLTTACANPPGAPGAASDASLELLQTIEIPADTATVRLQFGHIVVNNAVQEFEPFCVFEVDNIAPRIRHIQPERFAVMRVIRSIDPISAALPFQPQAAISRAVMGSDDDRPSHIYYKTTFRLHSEHQPSVRSLTCMSNQMQGLFPLMRHLSLDEMRTALGRYFQLQAPNAGAAI